MKLCNSPDPSKAKLSADLAEQMAEYEARNGKVQTTPLRELSHDGRTVVKGRVQMTISQQWKEGAQ
jgi:hypothetical protein